MKIKKGASLQGLKIQMRVALKEAADIWDDHAQELVITSGTDGEHSPGSLHYYGYAVDLRTRYFTDIEKQMVFVALSLRLKDKGFIVIMHDTHIHVEYYMVLQAYDMEK